MMDLAVRGYDSARSATDVWRRASPSVRGRRRFPGAWRADAHCRVVASTVDRSSRDGAFTQPSASLLPPPSRTLPHDRPARQGADVRRTQAGACRSSRKADHRRTSRVPRRRSVQQTAGSRDHARDRDAADCVIGWPMPERASPRSRVHGPPSAGKSSRASPMRPACTTARPGRIPRTSGPVERRVHGAPAQAASSPRSTLE